VRMKELARKTNAYAGSVPGVMTPTQPKVPEAKVRGSQHPSRDFSAF